MGMLINSVPRGRGGRRCGGLRGAGETVGRQEGSCSASCSNGPAGRSRARPVRRSSGVGRGPRFVPEGWRLVSIDEFELDVPDTPGNAEEFGYAGTRENGSAFCNSRATVYQRLRTNDCWSPTAASTLTRPGYRRRDRRRPCCGGPHPTEPAKSLGLRDGTYLSVVMDSGIRGGRRDKIAAAATHSDDVAYRARPTQEPPPRSRESPAVPIADHPRSAPPTPTWPP